MGKFFLLFSNCIPVKGISRSIICDLQREEYCFIPNDLVDIINDLKKKTIDEILFNYSKQGLTQERLDEYLEYLIINNLGFYTDSPEEFPEIDLVIDEPSIIEDAIIEWSDLICEQKTNIIKLLRYTGCSQLEIRCFSSPKIDDLCDFLNQITLKTKLRNCEIILPYQDKQIHQYENIVNEYPIIGKIYIYNVAQNYSKQDRLHFLTQNITNSSCCGIVGKSFNINLYSFIESQKYNPCLNRKFAITINGDIKNCPSTTEIFGNIIDGYETILETIKNKKFQKLWNISKDQIEICNFCEFRYICGDCRAFLSKSTSKPIKCNYNPKLMKYES